MKSKMTKIYIQLLDEGTTVYRPTQAVSMGNATFLVLPTSDYDPDDEVWEFLPGSLVACDKEIKGGEEILIARRLVSKQTGS
jgi:hypothetical protein